MIKDSKEILLFLPTHASALRAFEEIALQAKKHGIESEFLILPKLRNLPSDESIPKIHPDDSKLTLKLAIKITALLSKILKRLFPKIIFFEALIAFLKIHQAETALAFQLKQKKIKKIVLFGDRHFSNGYEPFLIKYALHNSIPIIIPPHGHYSDIQSPMGPRRSEKYFYENFRPHIKSLVRPVLDPKTEKLLSFHSQEIVQALSWNGLKYANPWVLGGSFCTKILTDCEYESKRIIFEGCPPERTTATGQLIHDKFVEILKLKYEIRKKMESDLGVSAQEDLIIIALPQLFEHGLLPENRHWQEIEFLLSTMAEWKKNCLISLHPKMNKGRYLEAASQYGLKVLDKPLKEVFPVCDIFMSTFSSTTQWAGICSIPSIVFDFYGLDYDVYQSTTGIKVINDKTKLRRAIADLFNTELRKKLHQAMKSEAEKYAILDGYCEQRIMKHLRD